MVYKSIVTITVLFMVWMLPSCGGGKAQKKPNILLITIDTLRRDHLGAYGYHRETSPFIDNLAGKGLRFKHVVTPISATSSSHASILSSLHPITHNVISNGNVLNHKVQTLAEVLKKNGYYTMGTVAVAVLSSKYKFSQGFDSFSDTWDENVDFNLSYQRTAQSVNKSVFGQLAEYLEHHREEPLFMWVHYYDPHVPYRSIKSINFKTNPQETKVSTAMNRYDKEIRYTDEHIKKLYNHLKETGLAKGLVTCITADHGEQFGAHGYAKCHSDFYTETTLVPLIFHGDGIPGNKVIEKYVSTMDIAVTLLGLINRSFEYPVEGINLMKPGSKSMKHRDRNFLITGYPYYTKSIQLVKYPLALILNYDHYFKYLYISAQKSIPGKRFRPVQGRHVKRTGSQVKITFPAMLKMGLHYAVLRVDLKENKGISVKTGLMRTQHPEDVPVESNLKHLDIVCPTVILSHTGVVLELHKGTKIEKLSYVFISGEEFKPYSRHNQKINNDVFERLMTRRKNKKGHELYDLSVDTGMLRNLLVSTKFKTAVAEHRESLYAAYKKFFQKKIIILKGVERNKELTKKQKDMLRSLGYL